MSERLTKRPRYELLLDDILDRNWARIKPCWQHERMRDPAYLVLRFLARTHWRDVRLVDRRARDDPEVRRRYLAACERRLGHVAPILSGLLEGDKLLVRWREGGEACKADFEIDTNAWLSCVVSGPGYELWSSREKLHETRGYLCVDWSDWPVKLVMMDESCQDVAVVCYITRVSDGAWCANPDCPRPMAHRIYELSEK